MALPRDQRHNCSFTVKELEDAVNQYFTINRDLEAHRRQIRELTQEKRDLEIQLQNADQNTISTINQQIDKLDARISFSIAGEQQLKQQLSFTKQLVDQLSNEYDQGHCGQFFHKPRIF